MDARLDFALELERRDAAVAERLELLARLAREVGAARAEALRLTGLLERLPVERARLEAAAAAAAEALERARADVVAAEEALAGARGDEARSAAERRLTAAAADAHAAEAGLERTGAQRQGLERDAQQAASDAHALAAEAARLARALEQAPRVSPLAAPGSTLEDVLEWAARAHAALVVARGGLETEREGIVREANELAAAVLGEPFHAASVAAVRRRVEERVGVPPRR